MAESAERATADEREAAPAPPPNRRPGLPWTKRAAEASGAFLRGVYRKADEDNIFFMGGAIAFNVLVAFIPLLVAVVGIAGFILRIQGADAQAALLDYVRNAIPVAIEIDVRGIIDELTNKSAGIFTVGTLFLIWVSTRLVGTLRTVLREIFDFPEGRSIITGKLFDAKMVLFAGTLFALNVSLTVALEVAARYGAAHLGLGSISIPQAQLIWARVAAVGTIWVMFILVYRYLPPKRIRWGTALTAATFAAIFFELLKTGFSIYVTSVASYRSAYGTIATFIVLVLWIYYSSLVFILGGEVAQVVAMQRIRKRQKERLS